MIPAMIVFMAVVTVVAARARLGAVPVLAKGGLAVRAGVPALLAGSIVMAALARLTKLMPARTRRSSVVGVHSRRLWKSQ